MSGERTSLRELGLLLLRLGATAFGGPAAHVAMMQDEVVNQRKWLTEERFLDLLGATNLIPGPNSTEMAIHIGWDRRGWAGLVVAGVAFILPAMLITGALGWVYVRFGTVPSARWLLYGVKPVILAVVVQALWGLAPKAARTPWLRGLGLAAAVLAAFGGHELAILFGTGAGTFRLLLDLPARSRVEFSRATDLSTTGIIFCALYGVGGALLTALAARPSPGRSSPRHKFIEQGDPARALHLGSDEFRARPTPGGEHLVESEVRLAACEQRGERLGIAHREVARIVLAEEPDGAIDSRRGDGRATRERLRDDVCAALKLRGERQEVRAGEDAERLLTRELPQPAIARVHGFLFARLHGHGCVERRPHLDHLHPRRRWKQTGRPRGAEGVLHGPQVPEHADHERIHGCRVARETPRGLRNDPDLYTQRLG
jgi:chromate transport protein ChrA